MHEFLPFILFMLVLLVTMNLIGSPDPRWELGPLLMILAGLVLYFSACMPIRPPEVCDTQYLRCMTKVQRKCLLDAPCVWTHEPFCAAEWAACHDIAGSEPPQPSDAGVRDGGYLPSP